MPDTERADSFAAALQKAEPYYFAQFDEVDTSFDQVVECDHLAVLEWSSRGTLAAGRDIKYRGVSILSFDGDGKVSRFLTYYDTAAFVGPTS